MALLAAGMLLTGCAKDSENNGMEETGRYLSSDEIRELLMPLLVGTWVHDGDSEGSIKSIGADGITAIDSEYTFHEVEKDTITFAADGKVHLSWPDDGTLPELIARYGFNYDGMVRSFHGIPVIDITGYAPPYSLSIIYEKTPFERGSYQVLLFDATRRYIYLKPKDGYMERRISRYRKL